MKQVSAFLSVVIALLAVSLPLSMASCATARSSEEGVSLVEAIELSAQNIAAVLPAGSRVAIVTWDSPSASLSTYIMEELAGALLDRGMVVVDRQNLELIAREQNFQLSGLVSDETARSIGHFLGADVVITGQFTELGGPYRYRASTVNVEGATRDSITRLDVRGDAETQRIVTAFARQGAAAPVQAARPPENNPASPPPAQSAGPPEDNPAPPPPPQADKDPSQDNESPPIKKIFPWKPGAPLRGNPLRGD
jgi:curli biogenesis system outer membrane secretion channel CsgG